MDKDKLIQALSNLPEEFFTPAYVITAWDNKPISIQMKYNKELIKELVDANRWQHEIIRDNGFMKFERDDGLEVIMT